MSRRAEAKPRAKSAKSLLKESIDFNHPPATTPTTPDNIVEAKLTNNLQIFLKVGRLASLFGLSANVQFGEDGIVIVLCNTDKNIEIRVIFPQPKIVGYYCAEDVDFMLNFTNLTDLFVNNMNYAILKEVAITVDADHHLNFSFKSIGVSKECPNVGKFIDIATTSQLPPITSKICDHDTTINSCRMLVSMKNRKNKVIDFIAENQHLSVLINTGESTNRMEFTADDSLQFYNSRDTTLSIDVSKLQPILSQKICERFKLSIYEDRIALNFDCITHQVSFFVLSNAGQSPPHGCE